MLACDRTLSLVQHEAGADTDTYTIHTLANCSWYAKAKVSVTDKGLIAARAVSVRIPNLPSGVNLKNGDFLVNGEIASVTKPSDLAAYDYCSIVSIGDNTRGRFPHWAVIGA